LAGAILSILINPLAFAGVGLLKQRLQPREEAKTVPGPEIAPAEAAPADAEVEELAPTALTDHAVLVGYGRVGSVVGEVLIAQRQPLLVVEEKNEIVERLRGRGVEVILGPLAPSALIEAANLARARWLFVAIPDAFEAGQIVEQARAANPDLSIIARAHSDAEVDHLQQHGADTTIMGEREIARAMIDHAFAGAPAPQASRVAGDDIAEGAPAQS
jgi:monovalent cation:H+ antiporter-2, CPA2 family